MNTIRFNRKTCLKAIISLLVLTMTGAACIKIKFDEEQIMLSVTQSSLSFPTAGGSQTFSVYSNDKWSVSKDVSSWLTVSFSNSSGSNNGTVTVTAAANTDTTSRTAAVTVISNAPGVQEQHINVTQDAVLLTVLPTTCHFVSSGGTSSTISVTSNQVWTVSSNVTWLTTSRTNGSNDNTFTLTATENPFTSSRSATVTVSGGGVTRTMNVTQDGKNVPANDECANATLLSCGVTLSGTLTNATPTTNIRYSDYSNFNDVFYYFTATITGYYTITLNNLPDDKDLFLYSNCDSTNALASSANGGASADVITYYCTAGTTYRIRITDCSNTGGTFNIKVDCSSSSSQAHVRFQKLKNYIYCTYLEVADISSSETIVGYSFGKDAGISPYYEITAGIYEVWSWNDNDDGGWFRCIDSYYFAAGYNYTVVCSDDGSYLNYYVTRDGTLRSWSIDNNSPVQTIQMSKKTSGFMKSSTDFVKTRPLNITK